MTDDMKARIAVDREETAYAGGLFEGEGSIFTSKKKEVVRVGETQVPGLLSDGHYV